MSYVAEALHVETMQEHTDILEARIAQNAMLKGNSLCRIRNPTVSEKSWLCFLDTLQKNLVLKWFERMG